MTCRHDPGDTNCGKTIGGAEWRRNNESRIQREVQERINKSKEALTPDSKNYEVLDILDNGGYLVVKAQYPNCKKCSYEGVKIMVFKDTTPLKAMKWREIDPHFTDPGEKRADNQAPGPIARFPASDEGWEDAKAYVRMRVLRDNERKQGKR